MALRGIVKVWMPMLTMFERLCCQSTPRPTCSLMATNNSHATSIAANPLNFPLFCHPCIAYISLDSLDKSSNPNCLGDFAVLLISLCMPFIRTLSGLVPWSAVFRGSRPFVCVVVLCIVRFIVSAVARSRLFVLSLLCRCRRRVSDRTRHTAHVSPLCRSSSSPPAHPPEARRIDRAPALSPPPISIDHAGGSTPAHKQRTHVAAERSTRRALRRESLQMSCQGSTDRRRNDEGGTTGQKDTARHVAPADTTNEAAQRSGQTRQTAVDTGRGGKPL